MSIKTAQAFLGAAALRRKTVSVDGGELTIREMSITERTQFSQLYGQGTSDALAYLLGVAVLDPDTGAALLSGEDAHRAVAESGRFVKHVVEEILLLSGLGGDDSGNDRS
jgi:hypothetical protein